jgi:DNA modification methylase
LNRSAVGFDLKQEYTDLSASRLGAPNGNAASQQMVCHDDARNVDLYLEPDSVSLIFTSPPYANLLNRPRLNKSRRSDERGNEQFLKIEQYSQDTRDLGTLGLSEYQEAMAQIFQGLLPLLRSQGHCLIDVPDMWQDNQRVTIHMAVVDALRQVGYELRNIIIWDRTNIVNRIGIFGWPSNYITMGTTFEYLLDFWKPPTR